MRIILLGFLAAFMLACNTHKTIVDTAFIDSVMTMQEPPAIKTNAEELTFWGNRIDPKNPGITNESRYAGALAARFALLGDINDIRSSDSILRKINNVYNNKESTPYLSLTSHAISQHRFKDADSLMSIAKKIGLKTYDENAISFDVNFELGRYDLANSELNNIKDYTDYGYDFRRSKMAHYKGEIDTAIIYMLKAENMSGNMVSFKQAALSNAADLYLHSGKAAEAENLYKTSIRLNPADYHSIMGLGWLALVHDKNDSLAKAIFEFVHSKSKSADPLFKLTMAAEAKNDTALQQHYANAFITQVTDTLYGGMYNKYLIQLYTGIMNNPAKAEQIAEKELANRGTPQTYAWYAWTLYYNNKKDDAYKIFSQYVSGKPLEALELYWMGKMMQGLGKGYNAKQFFTAAYNNKYDLCPAIIRDLDKALEE